MDQIVISNWMSWGTVSLKIIDTDCMDWHLEWTVFKGNQKNPYGAAWSYKAMAISWLYFKKLLSRQLTSQSLSWLKTCEPWKGDGVENTRQMRVS